ncbi:MAG TPA: Ig-like domain-containing protein, partial [Saprospiraceae bacterium]|nr:Ig-like domain-containing protein [Saprospiraceae bacterium]
MQRLFLLCLALSLCACARQGAPTGGPRDTVPPRIDSTASTPNYATNFQEREIRLRFDEWVVLADVATQVLVSPPLRTKRVPDISLKGKTVVVKIPEGEDLRPNTTYTINFGTAVKDLHEGNPAKDLRFVFSTGSFIDSLKVEGYVFDAFKQEPVDNVAVMMYEELADSVPRKIKPFYFSRTDKLGFFSIPNVKAGRFKVMAVDDKDQNLLWNGGDERISFLPQPLDVTDTLRRPPLTLYLYTDQGVLRSKDRVSRNYGQVKITYNAPPDSVAVRSEPPGQTLLREIQNDTLLLWYDRAADSTAAWQIIVGRDTVPVKTALTRAAFLKTHRLTWGDE